PGSSEPAMEVLAPEPVPLEPPLLDPPVFDPPELPPPLPEVLEPAVPEAPAPSSSLPLSQLKANREATVKVSEVTRIRAFIVLASVECCLTYANGMPSVIPSTLTRRDVPLAYTKAARGASSARC
ncbi:MAG TPA: hypothetical protein VM820_19620, partial [Vicinamibacterales bacterium]|nr:hypothetical protein [Vicinamibacterales bacterium]